MCIYIHIGHAKKVILENIVLVEWWKSLVVN